MTSCRIVVLGMLVCTSAASVASGQQDAPMAQPTQIQMDLSIMELAIAKGEEKHILKGLKAPKGSKIKTGAKGNHLCWSSSKTEPARTLIQRMKQRGSASAVAQPKMVVLSGQTGRVFSGQAVPLFENAAQNGGIEVKFEDVGVSLETLATVTKDDKIFLALDFKCSMINPKAPPIATSRAAMHVSAEIGNGDTLYVLVPAGADAAQASPPRNYILVMATAKTLR